jgi:hypothetical protein
VEAPRDVAPPLEEAYEDPADDTVRSILSQFGAPGDVEIKVYRKTPTGKSYCYTTSSQEFSEESIRDNPFGGPGRYALHIYAGGEFRLAKDINIEGPQLARNGASRPDDLLMRMLEQRLASIEARLSAPAQQSEPMSAVLQAAVNLINAQMVKPVETPMEQVMKMAEFIVSMRGGDKDDTWKDVLSGIAREVAPTVLPMLMGPRPGAPVGAPAQQQIGGDDVKNTEEQARAVEAQLRAGIAYLKKKCMIGADPELYLGLILDSADDESYARLIHLATTQEFELFARLDGEIANAPYREFFETIYNGIRSAYQATNPVAVDPKRASGNVGNAAVDAASRKNGSKR